MDSSPLAKAGVTSIVVWLSIGTVFATFYIGEYINRPESEKSVWKAGVAGILCLSQVLGTGIAATGLLFVLAAARTTVFKNFWSTFEPVKNRSHEARNYVAHLKETVRNRTLARPQCGRHEDGVVVEKSTIVAEREVLKPHEKVALEKGTAAEQVTGQNKLNMGKEKIKGALSFPLLFDFNEYFQVQKKVPWMESLIKKYL